MKNTNNEIIRITHIDKMSGKHPHGLKPLPRSDQPLLLSVGGRVCLSVGISPNLLHFFIFTIHHDFGV